MNQSQGWTQNFQQEYVAQTINQQNYVTNHTSEQAMPYLSNEQSPQLQIDKVDLANPDDVIETTEQLTRKLTSFSNQGQVTNIVISMFSADQVAVSVPPTIFQLLQQIIDKENAGQFEMESIGMQLGDIIMCYGQLSHFTATMPKKYLQKYGHQINHLVTTLFPKNTRGITLNLQQIKKLCQDCQISDINLDDKVIIDSQILNIIFTRASYLQAKFICDYCFHSEKSEAYIVDKFIQEYRFSDYDITKINISIYEDNNYKFKEGNPKVLNYIGFLIFIQLLSFQIVSNVLPKYFYEGSNLCYSNQPNMLYSQINTQNSSQLNQSIKQQSQFMSASQNHLSSSMANNLENDAFKSTIQYIQIGNATKQLTNSTYALGWKLAYIFACMLDHAILTRSKRFGYNQQSDVMRMALFLDNKTSSEKVQFQGAIIKLQQTGKNVTLQRKQEFTDSLEVYYLNEQALDKYINKIKGTRKNLSKDMVYRVLKDSAIIQQISAQFVYEYIMRNHTEFDKNYVPELTKEQLINCIFVGANLAFARHPFIQHLKSPEQRFKYAIGNILKDLQ